MNWPERHVVSLAVIMYAANILALLIGFTIIIHVGVWEGVLTAILLTLTLPVLISRTLLKRKIED